MDRPANRRSLRVGLDAEAISSAIAIGVYGEAFTRRLSATGIRDRLTAPRSPWRNGHTERLIGSIRRECLDHVVVFGERHLRHVLFSTWITTMACGRTYP
jgi:transposase InsO family protein